MTDVNDTVGQLRTKAVAGDAAAMYQLGVHYRNGSAGVAQSDAEALHWYTASAQAGHIQAMMQLAAVYTLGRLAPTDHPAAASWLARAADLGHTHAMHLLAMKYSTGRDIPQDLARAMELYERAANLGHAGSMFELAMAYDTGLPNVPADPVLARHWLSRSAEAGDPTAKRMLEELAKE